MKLSIIIPTHNEEKLLPRLLSGIKSQEFQDYEIIIADADSDDKTKAIAKKNKCKIVSGGMPAQGRNKGAKAAKGEVLLFLDADTFMEKKDFLTKSLDYFEKENLGVMANSYKPLSCRHVDRILHEIVNNFLKSIESIKPMGGGMCIFVRKDVFDKANGFNEELLIGEDHEFVEKCSKISKFKFYRGAPIHISVRRLNTDGRTNICFKYTAHTLYRLFTGKEVTRKNKIRIFDYHFEHDNGEKRILYAVCGEGMGHSIRSVPIIEHLKKDKKVMIVASGRAYDFLSKKFDDVYNITGFNIVYEDNVVNNQKTFFNAVRSLPKEINHNMRVLYTLIRSFQPNIIISDFEFFSNVIAKVLNIPLISIDNQHIMTKTKLKVPARYMKDLLASISVIRAFIVRPVKYLVTTFFYPSVKNKRRVWLFPPILRNEILKLKPKNGKHVLVYQTSDTYSSLIPELKKLKKQKFVVYGLHKEKKEGNVQFRKFSEKKFMSELASSKAVITNGGFTVIGEALHLNKPILSVPVKKQFEQILNAIYIDNLGYGEHHEDINKEIVENFLANVDIYNDNLKKYPKEDNTRILEAIDHLIDLYGKKYKKKK